MVEAGAHASQDVIPSSIRSRVRRRWMCVAGVASVIVGVPFVAHPQDSGRALQAIVGQSFDCDGNGGQIEVIAVPTTTSRRGVDGKYVPNDEGMRRIIAAVSLYKDAQRGDAFAPRVVFLGSPEKVSPEIHGAAQEAFFMTTYESLTGTQLSAEQVQKISSQTSSRNTAGNMQELATDMHAHGEKRAAIVTSDSHLPRALLYACAQGDLLIKGASADRIIQRESWSNYAPQSVVTLKQVAKEKIGQGAAFFVPRGRAEFK